MLLVSLRDRNCEFWSHLRWPGQQGNISPMQISSRARCVHSLRAVRKEKSKAKHHHTVSFRVFILIFRQAFPFLLYGSSSPPPAGWYSVISRVRYLGVPLIFRFLFHGIHFVQNRLHNPGRKLMSKPHWFLLKRFFKQMNTVNPLRLKIRWSQTPLLEILFCSHWMDKPELLTRCGPGLTWVMDSWSWWTPAFPHDSYASHAVCTLRTTNYLDLL